MIEIDTTWYVTTVLGCLLLGFGAGIVVLWFVLRSMSEASSKSNDAFRNQISTIGEGFTLLGKIQREEIDKQSHQAQHAQDRAWALVRMVIHGKVGDGLADTILPSTLPRSKKNRRIPLRTPEEEVRISRSKMMDRGNDFEEPVNASTEESREEPA